MKVEIYGLEHVRRSDARLLDRHQFKTLVLTAADELEGHPKLLREWRRLNRLDYCAGWIEGYVAAAYPELPLDMGRQVYWEIERRFKGLV